MKKDLKKNVILSLGVFLFLLLASCGSLRKEQVQREMGDVDKQARLDIRAGEFQKAIDLYREIYQKYPHDPTVRSNTTKTLESIKVRGDRAFERSHFETAGNIYEILAKNWSHFSDLAPSLSFDKNLLGKKIRTSRCLFIEQQVLSYLKAGEFQKAIDICNEIFRNHPRDSAVCSNTTKTLESIKISGDRAFERSDFALAGCAYEIVLKYVSTVTQWNGSFPFDNKGLAARTKYCKKILFENGLEQYRSGNLDQAISIWKSILAFDPENQEVKKVVDMATLQLRNLQKAK
jgi:tetratricopeptide (TPR) repeat protein